MFSSVQMSRLILSIFEVIEALLRKPFQSLGGGAKAIGSCRRREDSLGSVSMPI